MAARSSSSLALSLLVVAVAVAAALGGAHAATRLALRADGTFRIVVFADMHISGLGALNLCSDISPEEVRRGYGGRERRVELRTTRWAY